MRLAIVVLLTPVLLATLAPAAPVPRHLMPRTPQFHHPTAVGSKWNYERGGKAETHVLTEVKEEKGGAKVITIEFVVAEGKTKPWGKYRITELEWSMTEETGQPYAPLWPLLKLPLGEDRKWEFDVTRPDLGVGLKGTTAQAAKTQSLKTPAGTFDAVKVQARQAGTVGGFSMAHWYASGIGLIQIGDDTPHLTLKSFTPGKD